MQIEGHTVSLIRSCGPDPMSTYMVLCTVKVKSSTVAFGDVMLLQIPRWIISCSTGMFTPFVDHTISVVRKSRWSSDDMLNGTMTVFWGWMIYLSSFAYMVAQRMRAWSCSTEDLMMIISSAQVGVVTLKEPMLYPPGAEEDMNKSLQRLER